MIVISHPWEFVPKGSTHLNSLGGGQSGSTTTATTSSSTSSTSQQATSSTKSANDVGGQTRSTDILATGSLPASSQQLQQQQQPYFYLQKSHVNRILQSQNINVKGRPPQFQLSNSQGPVSSGDDSSLSDISFAYLHNKSPLISRINFETSVN